MPTVHRAPRHNKFEQLLSKALIQWQSDELKDFGEYFTSNYVPRKKEWATCYRINARINTNMYVEAFHRVLKHIYMKGTVNKRVDTCITTLLRFGRDKMFDRLLKIEKGKNSHRLRIINDRHAASLTIPLSHVKSRPENCNTWTVNSSSSSTSYIVCQVIQEEQCPHQCLLKCRACVICIHQYTCSCLDSLVRGTICKHIHLVRRYNNQCKYTPQPILLKEQVSVSESHLSVGRNAHNFVTQFSQSNIQERVSAKLDAISLFADTGAYSKGALLSIERHLNLCLATISNEKANQVIHQPSNKSITAQRHLYSTKRKRQKPRLRIAKPTNKEKDSILESLLSIPTIHISEEQRS